MKRVIFVVATLPCSATIPDSLRVFSIPNVRILWSRIERMEGALAQEPYRSPYRGAHPGSNK